MTRIHVLEIAIVGMTSHRRSRLIQLPGRLLMKSDNMSFDGQLMSMLLFVFFAAFIEPARALEVRVQQNTEKLMPYQVFELTFQHSNDYPDPIWDVTIEVEFTAPSSKTIKVGGFFYGSSKPQKPIVAKAKDGSETGFATWPCDPADLWKARFAPNELGDWRYRYRFHNIAGEETKGGGAFAVVKGRVRHNGWVRINPNNAFRLASPPG